MHIATHSETGASQNAQADRDLDRINSFKRFCERGNFSPATGRRILASGNGPRVTRLSARRIGIRERDYLAWLDARAKDGA